MGYTHYDKICGINNVSVGAAGSESDIIDGSGNVTAVAGTFTGALTKTGGDKTPAVAISDAATYTVLAADSGKLHIIPSLTADCVISLPTAAAGLYYRFIYCGGAENGKDFTLDTGSDTNFFVGGVAGFDTDATILYVFSDGDSNSKIKIDTPNVGTFVEVYCDGTNWFINGVIQSSTDTHSAFADQ